MTKPHLILAVLIAAAPLTACGEKKPAVQAQAGGEILPGSISDEMLPLDTATSQPPLAPKVDKPAAKSAEGDEGKDVAPDAPADDPAPEPAG